MGIVYVFTNDSMPGLVKIGKTDKSVEERLRTLDGTSVPTPFRFYFAIESDRFDQIETFIHNTFSEQRVRDNREFFKINPERAVSALKIAGAKEVKLANEMIDEDGNVIHDEEKGKKKKQIKFSFKLVGIPVGSELLFVRDETKKCTVKNENRVEYNGKEYSLSGLADKLLQEQGYKWKTVQGPLYFEYKGKILDQIKKELLEDEEEDT